MAATKIRIRLKAFDHKLLDQATGEIRGQEPLRTLATYRDSPDGVMFGMNLIPVKAGTVRVGDPVKFGS